jgi:alpha-beta hydrolase superfamily lysophospholipase
MTENQFSPITGINDRAVNHDQGKLITADQTELAWQAWTPPAAQGVIVVVHGLAEHSGRYRETAEYLANHGWAVIAADLRGHGRSADGRHPGRVHVDEFSDYFYDVDAMVQLAGKQHGELPLVLLGHSMGGLIALSYALEKPAGLDGAIISSPALGTHPASQPPLLLKLVVQVLSRLAPRLLFNSDLDTSAISRDPEVVRAYIDDPLVSNKVSARWYTSMMKAMDHAFDHAHSMCVPLLLMQSGADRLVDPAATTRWSAAAPMEYLDLVTWEGFYHEMLNEPGKDRVREKILSWLQRHRSM